MSVIKRIAPGANNGKGTPLNPVFKEVNRKSRFDTLKIPKYDEIDFDDEVIGIVMSCDVTENPDYVCLTVMLYYDVEGSIYKFRYNLTNQSADYLHRFACIFGEYKISFNLYSIIGKCFIGKIKKNKGYLNLVGIKSITREEMNSQLEYMKDCMDEDSVEDNEDDDLESEDTEYMEDDYEE